jgi:hypothetical protein
MNQAFAGSSIDHTDLGDEVTVEATFFLAEHLPDPTVIGWRGCLVRLRFAIDPSADTFYFGAP